MAATETSLLPVLLEHQLLSPEQLEEIVHLDTDSQVRVMVERGWVTSYQAEKLREGNGGSLFLGPYLLSEPLGEGGMGQVFKALHRRINRLVALKIIRESLAQNPEVIRRFQREARAAALLAHPNIVTLYDANQVKDTHFIAMEYVEGTDLSKWVREHGPVPVADACDILRQAALGLQHAHERGMVHRDIKPSNLLVVLSPGSRKTGTFKRLKLTELAPAASAPHGTLPRGFVIKILDMGLARLIESADQPASYVTHAGTVFGTPDYIAPEQARNAHAADIRSDLYSLGCTLYFLLTGQPPFPEGNAVEKLLMHQLDDPRPLEELRPGLPLTLQAIVRRLMAKRPADRFQTPQELLEAIDLIKASELTTEPVAGSRPSGLSTADEVRTVVLTGPTTKPIVPDQTAPVASALYAKKIAALKGHRGWVMAVDFSTDRNLLASAGLDGAVRLWGFSSSLPAEQAIPHAHSGEIHALSISPDMAWLASGSGALDGHVRLWERQSCQDFATLQGHSGPVEALTFAPSSKLLASGGCDSLVRVWDLSTPEPRERTCFKGHTDFIKALAFSPDGKLLASASQDATVRLWSLGRMWHDGLAVLRGHSGHVLAVQFSPNARVLASAGLDQTIRLWELTGAHPHERPVLSLRGHAGVVRQVHFTPKSKFLVSADNEGLVLLWNVETGEKVREWQLCAGKLASSFAFTCDGRYLATGLSDGSILVYRLEFRDLDS